MRAPRIPTPRALVAACCLIAVGCQSVTNPSFDLTHDQARADLQAMAAHPVTLDRPVVVIGGWGDLTGWPPDQIAETLRDATGDERIISIGLGGLETFAACRRRVIERTRAAFADRDGAPGPVDVIGFSMGGLVARYSAMPVEREPDPLRIVRLFSLAVPIRGAQAAATVDPESPGLVAGMHERSAFIAKLAAAADQVANEQYYYVRHGDGIVGAANAAPPGQTAWWVDTPFLQFSHPDLYKDKRILADIARRLRGEQAYATQPPAPLP